MILHHLSITNYRNIRLAELSFSPHINCFVGANGMGKSNVLDAIYYMSFCRGFASAQDAQNVCHEESYFFLEGDYENGAATRHHVGCSFQAGSRKRLRVDGQDVKRLSEHIGHVPLVIIAPSDSQLITGGSEERRRFADAVIMQYSAPYLDALIQYDKALKQRNALLKQEEEPDGAVMDVLEEIMAAAADTVYTERRSFTEAFRPVFEDIYRHLSGREAERAGLTYVSHMERGPLALQLREGRAKERIVGYTLHGVHKDEWELTLNTFAVKREASQGQQKTFFIAMKLAQFVFLKEKGEREVPLLLLDDVFDKLDERRVGSIISYVAAHHFGQIFITDTGREHLDRMLSASERDYKLFEVTEGEVTEAGQ